MTLTATDAWDRVEGDTNDTLVAQLDGVATLPLSSSVEAHVWRTGTNASTTTLTATVLDAVARTVLIQLGTWINTAALGAPVTVWRVEVQVTGAWSDGQTGPRTFPSAGGRPLTIRAAGG